MIISMRSSNFYSFAQEAWIDFTVGKKPISSGFNVCLFDFCLNKVLRLLGGTYWVRLNL